MTRRALLSAAVAAAALTLAGCSSGGSLGLALPSGGSTGPTSSARSGSSTAAAPSPSSGTASGAVSSGPAPSASSSDALAASCGVPTSAVRIAKPHLSSLLTSAFSILDLNAGGRVYWRSPDGKTTVACFPHVLQYNLAFSMKNTHFAGYGPFATVDANTVVTKRQDDFEPAEQNLAYHVRSGDLKLDQALSGPTDTEVGVVETAWYR